MREKLNVIILNAMLECVVSSSRVVILSNPKQHFIVLKLLSTSILSALSIRPTFLSRTVSFFGSPSDGPDNLIPCSLQNLMFSR